MDLQGGKFPFMGQRFQRSGQPERRTCFPCPHWFTIMNILPTKRTEHQSTFSAAETLILCENYTVYTHSKSRDMSVPLVWSREKTGSPRLSSNVQSAPHLPSPTGRQGRCIERAERRDYPACFSQPSQGQGHHVIMCE